MAIMLFMLMKLMVVGTPPQRSKPFLNRGARTVGALVFSFLATGSLRFGGAPTQESPLNDRRGGGQVQIHTDPKRSVDGLDGCCGRRGDGAGV